MAFVPSSTLLCDLLKAFGLEGRKGVRGLVLEVRHNEAARLHIEEFLDTDQSPLDDLIGCLHRLTVERAEVDGRGCVTPVLHKPNWLTPEEMEALRADIRASQSAVESRRRAELESVQTKFKAFVERVAGPDGVEAVDVTQWRVDRGPSFSAVSAEILAKSEAGQSYASSLVMLPAGADLDTAKAVLDATGLVQGSLPERDGWFTSQGLDILREHLAVGNTVTFANHAVKIETPDPDGNPADVTASVAPGEPFCIVMDGYRQFAESGGHIDWTGRVITEQAILDATGPDEPTVIDNSK